MRCIIVDDDHINCSLYAYAITNTVKAAEIICFQFPLEALAFIDKEYRAENAKIKTLLLLNINMPQLNGWEFLEEFSKMNKLVLDQFKIYMASSSINIRDGEKDSASPLIKGFLTKPLNVEKIRAILMDTFSP